MVLQNLLAANNLVCRLKIKIFKFRLQVHSFVLSIIIMEYLFAQKLKGLREKFGYSLQELADMIGVSRQSIHKFENDIVNPSSETLLKLSEVFNVPYSYFFTSELSFTLENIRFRDGHAILNRHHVETQIKAEVLKYVTRLKELEELLNMEKQFENPLAGFQIVSTKDIEKAARIIRRKWKLGNDPILDVTEMLEENGVFVVEVEQDEDFSGLSAMIDECIPIIVLNQNVKIGERKRFTALHELGHIVLEFAEDFSDTQVEEFCHHFAGAVLLVDEVLMEEIGRNRTSISLIEFRRIKERYGISIQAIIFRAKNAGVINFGTFFAWNRIYNDWRTTAKKDEFGEFKCKEKPARLDNLLMQGLKEKKISWSKAAEISHTKIDILKKQLENVPSFNIAAA
jgi:Zn-dependent peptidase ImmA (M78 family)/transcriptional regulator with XRE-family HTH domain